MEPAPAVTVLMPAYNAAPTIARAIASVLAQTDPAFELLVVDDGSTDQTAALAAGTGDPRVRVVARPHGGIVAALNAGLAEARAPLVARMDADDEMAPERLARQRAALEADPGLGLVGARVAHADDGGDTRGFAAYVDWLNGLVDEAAIALNRFIESPFAHPSVMFRRSLVDAHGGYADGPFPEDYELWLRWLEAGVRMAKVPATLLTWHDGPGRLTRTHLRYGVEAFYALKARYLARWLHAHGHARIVLWGSGKTSRQRAAPLAAQGITITGFIDVDPRRGGGHSNGVPIRYFEELGAPEGEFVVSYVGKRGARDFIRAHLAARGWLEGEHFLIAA